MWDSLTFIALVQVGGILAGFIVGYWLGRWHKMLGDMGDENFVKQFEDY
jgi:hypothetical protein